VEDHVHILCTLSRIVTISVLIRELSGNRRNGSRPKRPSCGLLLQRASARFNQSGTGGLRKLLAHQRTSRKETFRMISGGVTEVAVRMIDAYVWD